MRLLCALLLAASLAALGCGGDDESPEARIRARLAEVERLAEAGDVAGVKEFLSERYADPAGNDRRRLAAWLTFQRMQQRSLFVWSRIESLGIPEPGRAAVVLVAGMAASPVEGPADLARLRAEVWRIELALEEEGDAWRAVSASWRPTTPVDLL